MLLPNFYVPWKEFPMKPINDPICGFYIIQSEHDRSRTILNLDTITA